MCTVLLWPPPALTWDQISSDTTDNSNRDEDCQKKRKTERRQCGGQRVTQTDTDRQIDVLKPSCSLYISLLFTLTFALRVCVCVCMWLLLWSRYYIIISLSPREHWALCELIKDTHCRLPIKRHKVNSNDQTTPEGTHREKERDGVCESEQREGWRRVAAMLHHSAVWNEGSTYCKAEFTAHMNTWKTVKPSF